MQCSRFPYDFRQRVISVHLSCNYDGTLVHHHMGHSSQQTLETAHRRSSNVRGMALCHIYGLFAARWCQQLLENKHMSSAREQRKSGRHIFIDAVSVQRNCIRPNLHLLRKHVPVNKGRRKHVFHDNCTIRFNGGQADGFAGIYGLRMLGSHRVFRNDRPVRSPPDYGHAN